MDSFPVKTLNFPSHLSGEWNFSRYVQQATDSGNLLLLPEIPIPPIPVWKLVALLLIIAAVAQLARTRWRLMHIPGPLIGSLTNFQRAAWVNTKRAHLILQDMHEKYGEVVRIGPNMVSFSNPDAISTVYTTRAGFPKGDFYATLRPYTRGGGTVYAVFNTTDEQLHSSLKSPIAPLFAPAKTPAFEGLVDEVLEFFQTKLDENFVPNNAIFNMGQWLQFFAFDVMGTMTFSQKYGFLETGKDVNGMLGTIIGFMRAGAAYTQMPWLDWAMRKNRIGDAIQGVFGRTPSLGIMGFVGKAILQKTENLAKQQPPDEDSRGSSSSSSSHRRRHHRTTHKDFLTHFIELQRSDPRIPEAYVRAWTFSNVIAGSDSVGALMRTTVFNLLRYPQTMQRLYEELNSSGLSRPFPGFQEIRNLPYLDACVQEAARMAPPFALPLERVVPEGGIEVLGHYLPAGTVVGANPYVVNRHKETFGQDAEFWRPERWLEGDEVHKKRLEQRVLTFGAGRRVCLGKYVGLLEIKKLVSFLVLNYEVKWSHRQCCAGGFGRSSSTNGQQMTIIDPERFVTENSWFFIQSGLYTQIKKRLLPEEVSA